MSIFSIFSKKDPIVIPAPVGYRRSDYEEYIKTVSEKLDATIVDLETEGEEVKKQGILPCFDYRTIGTAPLKELVDGDPEACKWDGFVESAYVLLLLLNERRKREEIVSSLQNMFGMSEDEANGLFSVVTFKYASNSDNAMMDITMAAMAAAIRIDKDSDYGRDMSLEEAEEYAASLQRYLINVDITGR